jgi:hypothetical protein
VQLLGQPAIRLLDGLGCGVKRNGTHVSRVRGGADALRQQTDPLEPAGRRFATFFLVLFRFGANAGARAFRTERWRDRRERSEVRGLRQQPARNRTDTAARQSWRR